MSATLIRAAAASDLQALARLEELSFGAEAWRADDLAPLLRDPGAAFALVDSRETLAGYALARIVADEAELLRIAVAAQFRRRGFAAALLEAVIAEASSRGAVRLFLEVASGNAGAEALYDRRGFREIGRRPGYYRSGRDARTLELRI